jgi:hypothetical protein
MDRKPITPTDSQHLKLPQSQNPTPNTGGGRGAREHFLRYPGESISLGGDIPPIQAPAAEIARHLAQLVVEVRRIANVLDPPPPDIVDSVYVAGMLGCTTTWVADMARNGEIPRSCIVTGTGNGKPWKFHRTRIDEWITRR